MNQIEKKREREKQMLQESCLRLYDLLENEKETAGGVDRGEQSQLRRVLQYYHLPIKETAAGLQHENIEHMLRRSGLITRRTVHGGRRRRYRFCLRMRKESSIRQFLPGEGDIVSGGMEKSSALIPKIRQIFKV